MFDMVAMKPIFLTIVHLHDDIIECSNRSLATHNFSHLLYIVKPNYSDKVFGTPWGLKGSNGPAKTAQKGSQCRRHKGK